MPASGPDRPAVLVGEGDRDLRLVLAALLEEAGYRAVAAADAREVLSRAIAAPPACIVLSARLPGGDPAEVLRGLRGLASSGEAPAVIIAPPDLPLGEADGFLEPRDQRLPATFGPADLIAAVRRAG